MLCICIGISREKRGKAKQALISSFTIYSREKTLISLQRRQTQRCPELVGLLHGHLVLAAAAAAAGPLAAALVPPGRAVLVTPAAAVLGPVPPAAVPGPVSVAPAAAAAAAADGGAVAAVASVAVSIAGSEGKNRQFYSIQGL